MGKRIVIALGGNALGKNLPEQMQAVKETSKAIADLIEAGHQVVIAHGNGPQVGMIQNAFAAYRKQEPSADVMPLSMCVAMSQGYIGYDLQNALKEELLNRGLQQGVATVLTQVVVDADDPAFKNPTKPIGAFMTKEEAEKMAREKGWNVAEDAGRGWRQVVASPKPMAVVELTTIRALTDAGMVVIACGGGGIPVIAVERHHLKGAAAVIDKDFASELLAEQLNADMLIILTAVEKVAVNFSKPDQKWLDSLTPEEARAFIERIRSLNTDATHNCWAFVAGPPGSTARIGCNDDGEPHGTAGRPMLQILLHSGVGQICAVVTRWFGGIKLGTGGLVRAYQDSVSNCLASLPTEILIPSVTLSLRMGYGDRDSALRLLRQCGGSVLSEDFSENVRLSVRVPESSAEAFRAGLFTAGGGKVVVEEEKRPL